MIPIIFMERLYAYNNRKVQYTNYLYTVVYCIVQDVASIQEPVHQHLDYWSSDSAATRPVWVFVEGRKEVREAGMELLDEGKEKGIMVELRD